jgi:hypothetical protein
VVLLKAVAAKDSHHSWHMRCLKQQIGRTGSPLHLLHLLSACGKEAA